LIDNYRFHHFNDSMPTPPQNLKQFSSLVQVIKDLRGPQGCPWDLEQTHQSLIPYAIEETFELVEALENQDDAHICEELGDVLFQVVLHAQLATDRQAFNIENVIETIAAKLIRRHPHVFAQTKVNSIDDIIANWAAIKAEEKKGQPQPLFKALKGLPALMIAEDIGQKTEKLKFDWSNPLQVLEQLKAEIAELEIEIKKDSVDNDAIKHEMGDVLFSAAQLARHLKIESESSLRLANSRFQKRFNFMLEMCNKDQETFKNLSTEEKEELWRKAKLKES